jgi:hypothetical protein
LPIFASDGSRTSPHTHAVENDVKNIRQSGVHDRAPSFFSGSQNSLCTQNIQSYYANNNSHYFSELMGQQQQINQLFL